jgi:hypothetical protein
MRTLEKPPERRTVYKSHRGRMSGVCVERRHLRMRVNTARHRILSGCLNVFGSGRLGTFIADSDHPAIATKYIILKTSCLVLKLSRLAVRGSGATPMTKFGRIARVHNSFRLMVSSQSGTAEFAN